MSFSDDLSSPAAPFSGDNNGQILAETNMTSQASLTNERIIETQSGYLLIIKKVEENISFSLKRKLGTLPTSSLTLTADETQKLSNILNSLYVPATVSNEILKKARSKKRRSRSISIENSIDHEDKIINSRSTKQNVQVLNLLHTFMIPLIGLSLTLVSLGAIAGYLSQNIINKPQIKNYDNTLSEKSVSEFVHSFISHMLDFGPNTYKYSQMLAMSKMSPELFNRYWTETKFPLSNKQLNTLPKKSFVSIKSLKQNKIDPNTVQVDVFAQICNLENTDTSTPIKLRLTITSGANGNGHLSVINQEDITNSTNGSNGSSK